MFILTKNGNFMSEKSLSALIALVMILIISFLIYVNEHLFIRNFSDYIREQINAMTLSLKREFKHHLDEDEGDRLVEILSEYGGLKGVKLVAVLDSLGEVLFYAGDVQEISKFKGSLCDTLVYIAGMGVYESISSVKSENGKLGWIVLKLKPEEYISAVKRTNLLIFSFVAVLMILGFVVIIAIYNQRIIKPVNQVSGFVQDIARGLYNIQINVPPSSSIYEFAENFNQMVKLVDEKEKRLEKQKSQFKLIFEISRLGLEVSSLDDFFKKVVALIRDEFKFLKVAYFTYDISKKLRLEAASGYLEGRSAMDYTFEGGYGIVGASVLMRDIVVVNDVSKSPQFINFYDAPVASEMAIPIKKKDKIVGVLDIASDKVNAFSAEEVRIFKVVAETMSLVIERFDSMMENLRFLFRIESIYRLARELVLIKDLDKIFEQSVKLIYFILNKKDLVVEIYELVGDSLVMRNAYGNLKEIIPKNYSQPANVGVLGKVVREKNFVYVPELMLEPTAERFYKTTSSEVAIPLIIKGDVIGVINCESGDVNAFDSVDILVLRAIADMLSIAIHNAQMYSKIYESESKYRAIFENLSEAIFRMDSNGVFVDVNPAFVEILGFELGDGVNFYDLFISKESVSKFKEEILLRGQVVDFDAKLRNKSGDVLSVKISLKKFVSSSGAIYYDGIIVDLTEYLKIMEKIHEAERLRELVQIAGGMAHEFNNIFASILGSAQLIKMKTLKESKIYQWADVIERSTFKGVGLVSKLVGYARGGKFRISTVNLNELVIDAIKKIKASEKISIRTEFDVGLPDISCDRDQILQVLIDVIQNGIEAMEDDGVLSVKTEFGYYDKDIVNDPDFIAGEYVRISISDTGIGITEEVKRRIFEPFFTTKRALGKSGLGLSMAYGVIKNHNGFIAVSSAPGQGSRFDIFLPVTKRKA